MEKYDSFIRKKGYRAGRYCISLRKCWHPCSLDLTKFLFILSPLILISLSVAPFAHNHKPTRHKENCSTLCQSRHLSWLSFLLAKSRVSHIWFFFDLKLFFCTSRSISAALIGQARFEELLRGKSFALSYSANWPKLFVKIKWKKRIKNRIIEFWFLPKGRGEQIKIDWLTGKKRNSTAWTEWDRSIARGRDG